MTDRLLFTPEQAAEMLSISRTTLYGLLASEELASVKLNRLRRIPWFALEAYVKRLTAEDGQVFET